MNRDTGGLGGAAKSDAGPIRIGVAVAANDHRPDTMVGERRDQPAHFRPIDDLFMPITKRPDPFGARAEHLQFRLVFRELDLAGGMEPAIIADQIRHRSPILERGFGKRDFGGMAAQPAHPAGVDAGGMTADRRLLQQPNLGPGAGQLKGGG